MDDDVVRLSAWVFFVDHGESVAVHHANSGSEWMTDRQTARRLERYAGFRPLGPDLIPWVDRRVLVRPFEESLVAPSGSSEEGRLSAAWNEWYWKREVESDREYRWQGEVVLKMPDDLFMYQELMFDLGVRRVLEIGYGRGGGLWFFASVLAWSGGGHVVGVDWDPPEQAPDFRRFPCVRVDRIHGDAHHPRTVSDARNFAPEFDLIVIDADPTPTGKLALLERWTPLLGEEGVIVIEDLGAPECLSRGDVVSTGVDQHLLSRREFGLRMKPRRFATSKANRAALQRSSATGRVEMAERSSAFELTVQRERSEDAEESASKLTEKDLDEAISIVRLALDQQGYCYLPMFSTDPSGSRLLALARALGSLYVPGDVDPNRPIIETSPSANASYSAPFDRSEGIGWHNDFSTHVSRPKLSLANLLHADPQGPSGGAWRVASCGRILEHLQGFSLGQQTLRYLTERDLPFSFTGEDEPIFFRVLESHRPHNSQPSLRFYARAMRDGARLAYGSVPGDIEQAIDVIESAANHVGHVIAAPVGSLLVTDNWQALHDRLLQCVDERRQLRRSLLCFVDNLHRPVSR